MDSLKYAFYELQGISKKRRQQLEESRKLYLFFDTCAEEDDWLEEQVQQVNSQDCGKDLASTLSLVTKHNVCTKMYYENKKSIKITFKQLLHS